MKRCRERWIEILENIKNVIEFDPKWHNGTGYLDTNKISCPENISKFLTDDSREGIIIPIQGITLVVFERYTLDKPTNSFILVTEIGANGNRGIVLDFIRSLMRGDIKDNERIMNAIRYVTANGDY